jgi:hypothetical protein
MRGRQRVALTAAALSLAAGGTLGSIAGAQAAASSDSPCVAVLTSYFGPQGSVDDAVHILQEAAAAQGITFGELAQIVAQTHGSLNDCLALVGQSPVG